MVGAGGFCLVWFYFLILSRVMWWSKKHILYLLFAYVLFQFLWWEILLVKLHHENIEKEKRLYALGVSDNKRFKKIESALNQAQRMKIIMVVGEGTVFIVLILFGFYKVLKAYEKEKELTERQMHFLLSLPHEIKTPLSVIQLNIQTIQQSEQLKVEQKNKMIESSLAELKRLNRLVDHMLLMNKISKGRYSLNFKRINLSDLLKEWIMPYSQERLVVQEIQEGIEVKADEFLLCLLIENLVHNAVKYSDKLVKVHLYKEALKGIILEVWNDGDLIYEKERERIFELFYRRPVDEQKGIKGTGLGLYIVKQIVDLHGFTIRVFTKMHCNVFQIVF